MTWKPGQSGNPNGRPAGSKNAFSEAFLQEFGEHFRKHGLSAIEQLYQTDPATYVKVAASLVPKGMDIRLAQSNSEQRLVIQVDAELAEQLNAGREKRLPAPESVESLLT